MHHLHLTDDADGMSHFADVDIEPVWRKFCAARALDADLQPRGLRETALPGAARRLGRRAAPDALSPGRFRVMAGDGETREFGDIPQLCCGEQS